MSDNFKQSFKHLRQIKKIKQPNLNGIALKGRKSLCLNEDLLKKEKL
jgi:hypothetical protein